MHGSKHLGWPIACNRIYLTLETQFNEMSGRETLESFSANWQVALKGVIETSCAYDVSDKNRVRLAEYMLFFLPWTFVKSREHETYYILGTLDQKCL